MEEEEEEEEEDSPILPIMPSNYKPIHRLTY
jgi:hypothetical protein